MRMEQQIRQVIMRGKKEDIKNDGEVRLNCSENKQKEIINAGDGEIVGLLLPTWNKQGTERRKDMCKCASLREGNLGRSLRATHIPLGNLTRQDGEVISTQVMWLPYRQLDKGGNNDVSSNFVYMILTSNINLWKWKKYGNSKKRWT